MSTAKRTRGWQHAGPFPGLLNIGDGLIGSLLDLRPLITTSAKKREMDAAVSRDGRLCRRVDVGPLASSDANAVLARLVPSAGPSTKFTGTATLARVYAKARSLGWMPPIGETR